MNRVWAVLALMMVAICGVGCSEGGKANVEAEYGTEGPNLKPWELPVAEVPKLLSGDVRAIAVDSGGAIWFGTYRGGVSRYDLKTRAWRTFTTKDGLTDNQVQAIAVDMEGALWFGTRGGGASRYDPKHDTWRTFLMKDGLAANNVLTIAADGDGALWFGTFGGDSGGEVSLSRYEVKSGAWTTFSAKDGLAGTAVQAIAMDGEGALWFGTRGGGVSRYDLKSREWKTFTAKNGLAANEVQAIAVDREGILWFGTRGSGVSRYDPRSEAWKTFTMKDGLAANEVLSIAVDREGVLWFGTHGGGVSRYNPTSKEWHAYTAKDGLPTNHVQAITVDNKGSLWFGTFGGGVSQYEPQKHVWNTFAAKDGLAYGDVQSMTVDRGGALWFGTYSGGVHRYDPRSGAWRTFPTNDGLADNDVQAIAVDDDGALWFGTCASGARRYDINSGAWKSFTSKDGLADDDVQAIAVDTGGGLWFGTFGSGVSRYDPKDGTWKTFTTKDGLIANDVRAIAVDNEGALWFGTFGGQISRYNPKTGVWKTFTTKDGLAGNAVLAMAADGAGALWFGAPTDGARRYDPKSGAWATFSTKDNLTDNAVQAIAMEGDSALWLKAYGGRVNRAVFGSSEAGALLSFVEMQHHRRILANHGTLVVTRPAGLSYLKNPGLPVALPGIPAGVEAEVLAPGPDESVWVGTDLGGLTLRKPGQELQITKEKGLPSMTVTALAPVPSDNKRVWVGTSGGVALVGMNGQELRVERVPTWEGMPTGPVDAIVAAVDGSVFIAYNKLNPKRFLDPKIAERRARTHVWHISSEGSTEEIHASAALAVTEIRDLVLSEKHGLWAGTSAGLFVVAQKEDRHNDTSYLDPAGFQPVTGRGQFTPVPIRKLSIARDKFDTLWMSVDKQGDTPPLVVGFRPGTGDIYNLTQSHGIPIGDVIDDLTFTDDGDLVVLVGSRLAKGHVFVPEPPKIPLVYWLVLPFVLVLAGVGGTTYARQRNSFAARMRRHPPTLHELPLTAVPSAFQALRRTHALEEVWTQLRLPTQSLSLVEPLASSAPPGAPQLRALAKLLGMESVDAAAEITLHPHGLTLLSARFPYPIPLRGHPIALVALDVAEGRRADPARVREILESALKQAGHRFELPYLLLANSEVVDDILPTNLAGLHLGEVERKALLFAHSPAYTLAGMLHTRGLLTLSPYDTSGSVKEEQMFFGRAALLRELLLASSVQQIIVGPRRVGKTSLLKNLLRELPARRPDTEVFFLDLLGIDDPPKAARALARQLKIKFPTDADPETALVDLLRSRFDGAAKKGVILIDEADGFVESDAKRGFPLLKAMRTFQAEGSCSFVLAGYLYLYREAMNQRSPLYNFATLRLLGPLDPDAARDLALVPMQRLGVTYADPALPARIAERTGGYPSFVQLLCDALLKELKGGDLMLTAAHLEQAERSPRVSGELGDIFRLNAGKITQIAVYGLFDRESFTSADADAALKRALGSAVPKGAVEQALLELRIFGFAVAEEGRYTWAIPLLRETLQAADPQLASARLVEELTENPEA